MRWLTIVVPAVFLLGLLVFVEVALKSALSPLQTVFVAFIISTAGIVLFSRSVFAVVDRLQEYLQAQNKDLELRTGQLRAIHEAAVQITSDLSLATVLQSVVDSSREVVGAKYAALSVLGDSGEIGEFITSGIDEAQRDAIGDIPSGHGLLSKVLRDGQAYRSADIPSDPAAHGFPPGHARMRTFLGVPVVYQGRVIGNLYLTDKLDGEFTQQDEDALTALAVQAAIAIENARLYERVQDVAVLEERERIGMDLHDGTIQSIYGVGLKIEDCIHGVDDAEVRAELDAAIESLNGIIRDIRSYIFNLRPLRLTGRDLVGAMRELMRDVEVNALVAADLKVVEFETIRDLISEEQASQLFHIAHEALTNIRKHANARRVEAELLSDGERIIMTISDDGRGIEPSRREHFNGRGMVNMAERARSLGGDLQVVSEPGKGTRLAVELPLKRETLAWPGMPALAEDTDGSENGQGSAMKAAPAPATAGLTPEARGEAR